MKIRHLLGASALGGVLGAALTLAIAQVTIPTVTSVGTGDYFQDIVGGNAQAGNRYATAAQINGPIGYVNAGVLATGQTLAFGNSTTEIVAQSSATIAAVTLTASASPGDGQLNCYMNTQTTSAITWNANTGQTISGAPTAGVANTRACMIYSAAAAAWVRAS
jgi:hypothetical protein